MTSYLINWLFNALDNIQGHPKASDFDQINMR